MINKRSNYIKLILLFLTSIAFIAFTFAKEVEKDGKDRRSLRKTDAAQSDAYRLDVNNISLGMNSKGVLADVDVDDLEGAFYDGKVFLFSSGFYLSGLDDKGAMWFNAVASASRIEDYTAGTVDGKAKGIFVVKASDAPFGESWQDWKIAVDDGGAEFYDGDKDGAYNPVDKNNNGLWDADEDKPNLIGDATVWCVFNDGVKGPDRATGFTDGKPMGIEIRQTVFAFATSGDLGNVVFVKYSITNTGTVSSVMDSVYLGIWADPDLGDPYDDLVGSDISLNAGFVYNQADDPEYGANPPCYLIDFFQGPMTNTGNPEDVYYNVKGPLLGIDTLIGAKDVGLTSFVHYMQGNPTQGDPDNKTQARNYLLGKNQAGQFVDPSKWEFGAVLGGVNPALIDRRYMYSGDPVNLSGWVNIRPDDQRQMSNTGPFKLELDKPIDVVVAYVVGRSTNSINSIKLAKKIDRAAQFVYDNNFNFPPPPPVVNPIIKTEDNAIELIWETRPQMTYDNVGRGYDMDFEAYEVYMYNTNSTADEENGQTNKVLIARYDVANDVKNILVEDPVSFAVDVVYSDGTQMDSSFYSDPHSGRIRLRIENDPFTGGEIIKGKPYFISIIGIGVNKLALKRLDAAGNYIIPGDQALGIVANIPKIINDEFSGVSGIVPGVNQNLPYKQGVAANHTAGSSDATVSYSVVDKSKVTDHQYEVGFAKVDTNIYALSYYVKDLTTGQMMMDKQTDFNQTGVNNLADGVIVNVDWVKPGIASAVAAEGGAWFNTDYIKDTTGAFYVGGDVDSAKGINLVSSKLSTAIKVDRMRRVELRFGSTSKAYRFVRNPLRYVYGGGNPDSGFVEVPFQAWVKDDSYGEEYQLAVGFTETAFTGDKGIPDAKYNPTANIADTKEYIVVFDAIYDPNGTNVIYTGTGTGTAANRYADLGNGYRLDATDPRVDSIKAEIARSPFFNAMYIVGLESMVSNPEFKGTYVIQPGYPLTEEDKFVYQVSLNLSSEEKKLLFDKVNVFPNPLYAYNQGVSYTGGRADEPYVTFSNLPDNVTIKIYSPSGILVRTLTKNEVNPYLRWDLENENGLRVASGMYIAIVSNPELGDKILKFAVILPQKQILRY